MTQATTIKRMVLPLVAGVGVLAALWLALASAPDAFQGDYVRIMYVHVPSSWLAVLAFTFAYAVMLTRRLELARLEEELERARLAGTPEVAGAAITAPTLEGVTRG